MRKNVIVFVDIAAFSANQFERWRQELPNLDHLAGRGTFRAMEPVFPALTCSMQATMFTGKPPADHGIVGNGWFDRKFLRLLMWPQEFAWIRGPHIADIYKEKEARANVALLFFMASRFSSARTVLQVAPLHTDKGIIENCYSKPPDLYRKLSEHLGEFKLQWFWGPLAGRESSRWAVDAALWILENETPDFLAVYLPQMDYVCQREGPFSDAAKKDAIWLDTLVGELWEWVRDWGNAVLVLVSEYGMTQVKHTVFPNRVLHDAGYLRVNEIGGGLYIDFENSSAFALCDHQIAHIYCRSEKKEEVAGLLREVDGVAAVWGDEEKRAAEIAHPRSGDLIILANPDTWFAYYYWHKDTEGLPFFARSVDIHNKPGYDPCELFFDPATKAIPLRPDLVKGSHGITGEGAEKALFICSKDLGDYAPERFFATHILAMLYRVM